MERLRAVFSDVGGDRGVGARKKVSHLFLLRSLFSWNILNRNYLYFLKDKMYITTKREEKGKLWGSL